jgi:SAM-dependent methyltransferase
MSQDVQARVTEYWNKVAGDFDTIYSGAKSPFQRALDRWFRKDMYQRFDWVMERAGDVSGQMVCDIGCGSGRFAAALAWRGAANVTGIDVAPEMLRLAHELAASEHVDDRCEFVLGDILDLDIPRSFDLTIAIGLWDYIPDPTARLARIRRLTRGKFLSAWPRRWTWRAPVRKVRLGLLGCPVRFFSRGEVLGYLGAVGFHAVRVDVVGKLFCVEAQTV